jgi:hypothetical protein
MQLTHLLALGLAGLTMAAQEAAMGAPEVKALLSTMNSGFEKVDSAIKAITEANVATQVPLVITAMGSLNTALLESSTKLKSSKALGILDMSSLSSSAGPIQKTMNTLITDVLAKRGIIVRGNQADAIGKGLRTQQAGFTSLMDAFQTQIPSQMAGQVPKGSAAPASLPAGVNIDEAQMGDLMYDIAIAVFKGTDTSVMVKGTIWPLPDGATAAAPKAASPAKGTTPAKTPVKGTTGARGPSKRSVQFKA